MKSASNLSVLFWANKARRSSDNLLPIYARITYMGKRAEVSLNIKVDAKKWNAKLGLMGDNEIAVLSTGKNINPVHYC